MAVKYSKTMYPGVVFREVAARGASGSDRVYFIKYRTPDGKQHMEKVGRAGEGMTPALANIERGTRMNGKSLTNEQRRKQKEKHERMGDEVITLQTLYRLYDDDRQERKGRQTDAASMKTLGGFTAIPVGSITSERVSRLARELRSQNRERPLHGETVKLSKSCIFHLLEIIQRVMRHAAKRGYYSPLPEWVGEIELPKTDSEARTECMTPEQLEAYWNALNEDPDRQGVAYITLILLTGIRKTAALELMWSDVDFERKEIRLRGDVAKNKETAYLKVNGAVIEVLKSVPRYSDRYIFTNPKTGKRRVDFRNTSVRIRDKAGLPNTFRPLHGLRHNYASWLASSGRVTLYQLKEQMTHKTLKMTGRYAHLLDESRQQAADAASVLIPVDARGES